MKRIIKISALGLICFAVASNIYASTVSFYGLKNGTLGTAVIAAAMYDTNTADGGSGGTSDNTNSTSSSPGLFDSPIDREIRCGATRVSSGQTSAGTAGASVGFVTYMGQVVIQVNYANATNYSYSQVIPEHSAVMRQCIGPKWAFFCTGITAIEACQ
jgi:hypothetical protein